MGAASVRAMCAHGLFSGNAIENIENSVLDEVIIADTIPLRHNCDKIKVISVAKLLAEVIQSVVDDTSISSHYYLDLAFIFKTLHWPGGNIIFLVSSFMLIPLTVITAVYLCLQDGRKNKRDEHE